MQYAILLWLHDEERPPIVISSFRNQKELKAFKDEFFEKLDGSFKKMTVITVITPEVALKKVHDTFLPIKEVTVTKP